MALHRVSSHDDTLANNSPAGSLSQFESFPPLLITRSNVLNTPSLRLEPILSRDPDEGHLKAPGSRRWFILSLSCLLLFGNYFAYDNPAALNTQLQKYLEMPYNEYQYLLSTLYSVYSLPNTVLPFLFGSLVDTLGPQRVLLMLSSCVCIGQTIFSIGVQTRQVWMMLLGRAIFGIGGESCGVAQASITTMYFRIGRECDRYALGGAEMGRSNSDLDRNAQLCGFLHVSGCPRLDDSQNTYHGFNAHYATKGGSRHDTLNF
ncbi:hypothetical protein EDD11_007162 [Mortierella claussenii]|nr:hypothetical protein EDD11_007162 [Mortierella claussenii]